MANNITSFPSTYEPFSKKVINTPSKVAKETFFYVQEVGHIGLIKPHRAKRVKLDSYLFVFVESGKGYLTYNSKTYTLESQQCFFIDCNHSYEHRSSTESPWTIRWVHFHGIAAASYYHLFHQKHEPVFTPDTPLAYSDLLLHLLQTTEHKTANTELEAALKLTELLTMILSPKKATASFTDPMATKCEHVKLYIDDHFTSSIQLEDLANQFFVSKFYLSREFKKIYGQSIIDYTISKRITLAKQLLRYTDSSIHEIALECGFQDQGYFNKQFKKLERITGREYRKQWR